MTTSVAFFLSPAGHLIRVPVNHISTVIADLKMFGLTFQGIRAVYDRHRERVGIEGEARREILLKVIENGWIRIRRYPNRHWSVTASNPFPSVRKKLQRWAVKMLLGIVYFREPDRYMPVRVSTPEGLCLCTIEALAGRSRIA